jgi:UrcA family protein
MFRAEKDSGLAETPVNSRIGSRSGAPSTSGQMGWQAMRKTYALSKLAAAAATIGGLFLPITSATAKEGPVVVTAPPQEADLVVRRVGYADLDLALPDGRATLHHRVGFAVGDVCAEANLFDNGSPEFKTGVLKCSNAAWNSARPQIARAIQRANDIAARGWSPIAAATISISVGR